MNSNQLLKFKAIADNHSITKAADALFMTQSALSHALSIMEEELGCKLFVRGPHKEVLLTKDGEDLLEYANTIDSLLSQVDKRFSKKIIISISAVNIASGFLLINFPKDKLDTIRMISAKSTEMPKMLLNGELDIAICDERLMKEGYESKINAVPLAKSIVCTQQLSLLVRENQDFFNRDRITYEELGQTPLSIQSEATSLNEWISYIYDKTGYKFNITFATDNYSYNLLRDDLSYPELIIKNSVYNPFARINSPYKYKIVVLDGFYSYREIYMYYMKKSTKKVQPILDSLKSVYTSPSERRTILQKQKVKERLN